MNHKVDLVLPHTCPMKYMPYEVHFSGIDQSTVDHSTEVFTIANTDNSSSLVNGCTLYDDKGNELESVL